MNDCLLFRTCLTFGSKQLKKTIKALETDILIFEYLNRILDYERQPTFQNIYKI